MLILKGHKGRLRCLAFSPDGRFLASAAGRGTAVSLWDTARGKRLGFLGGHPARFTGGRPARVACLAFSPGPGGLLASAAPHGPARLWDPATRQPQGTLAAHGYHHALCFSPDGSTLAVASHGWPGYTVELLPTAGGRARSLNASSGTVWSVAFAPDGRTLAVGCDRGTDLWNVGQRRVRGRLPQRSPVRALAWSPDGKTLACSARQAITLWDVAEGKARLALSGHTGVVNGLAFSADGRTLVTAGSDGSVRLWDPRSGRQGAALDWRVGEVRVVAIAPDCMRAAAGGDADIVLWDLDEA